MLDVTIELMSKKETDYPYFLKDILDKPGLYEHSGDGFILISKNGSFLLTLKQ